MSVQVHDPAHAVPMFNQEEIKTIREAFCVGATDSEFQVFIKICELYRLSPFNKQIYFTKAGGKMTTITSIDGLRAMAERTKKYMPGKETVYAYDKMGALASATAYVKKLGPDSQWHEVSGTAMLKEYKKTGVWDKMPHVMLAKCAESVALRRGFPSDLAGLYEKSEIEVDGELIQETGEIAKSQDAKKIDAAISAHDPCITTEHVMDINHTINRYISPVDPDYVQRMLMAIGAQTIPSIKLSQLDRVRRNIANKIAEVNRTEIPETPMSAVEQEEADKVPF